MKKSNGGEDATFKPRAYFITILINGVLLTKKLIVN